MDQSTGSDAFRMRLFGVKIRLHPLFGMVMFASVVTGYFAELLTLFGIVLLHELGHAAMATHFKWKVREIHLLPFGGVAQVQHREGVPSHEEFLVSLAGPFQNMWMIGVAALCNKLDLWPQAWGDYFIMANLMIGLFNLLPILPLDGGRILQAGLSLIFPYYKSLQMSSWMSLIMSVGMVGYAFVHVGSTGIQFNLLCIGLFLTYSNWMDMRLLHYQYLRFLMYRAERIAGMKRHGKKPSPIVASSRKPVQELLKLLMRDRYHQYVLLNEQGRIQQIVTELQLVNQYLGIPCSTPNFRVK